MRQRKCVISGENLPESELIRFVADAAGNVLVDVRAKAPGRGVWVTAARTCVQAAVKQKAFARGLKTNVQVPDDLADQVQQHIETLCLDLLGMARRAGQLVSGFEKVRAGVRADRPGWLIEASDGAQDGRRKIVSLSKAAWDDVCLVGCFHSSVLGKALGRDQATHILMHSGAIATHFGLQLHRLSGFTPIIPVHWEQKDG